MIKETTEVKHLFVSSYPISVRKIITSSFWHDTNMAEEKHSGDLAKLVIISRGEGELGVEDRVYYVTSGDVFLLNENMPCCFNRTKKMTLYYILFKPEALFLPKNERYFSIFTVKTNDHLHNIFAGHLRLNSSCLALAEFFIQQMQSETDTSNNDYGTFLLGNLIQLIVFVSRQHLKLPKISDKYPSVKVLEVIDKLERNYSKQWTLAELASLSGMSESSFLKLFKKETGCSPIAYLIRHRLKQAAELLSDKDLSVTEIAFHVGFNDSNYFTRQFSNFFQVPPTKFRKHTC